MCQYIESWSSGEPVQVRIFSNSESFLAHFWCWTSGVGELSEDHLTRTGFAEFGIHWVHTLLRWRWGWISINTVNRIQQLINELQTLKSDSAGDIRMVFDDEILIWIYLNYLNLLEFEKKQTLCTEQSLTEHEEFTGTEIWATSDGRLPKHPNGF